jgi:hypothetical protein
MGGRGAGRSILSVLSSTSGLSRLYSSNAFSAASRTYSRDSSVKMGHRNKNKPPDGVGFPPARPTTHTYRLSKGLAHFAKWALNHEVLNRIKKNVRCENAGSR